MIEYENLFQVNKPFRQAFAKKLDEVLQRGWFILGDEVKEFEERFARYCGAAYCVSVANGLDALTLALRAFSFKEGAEVIVPSNTYIATIFSILNARLRPVLVEPDITTYTIRPDLIEQSITPNTVAIMPVHLYGKCCDMEKLMAVAKKFNLKIIEDCAQAHGAAFKGKKAGTFGDFGAFSFYPTKNLGALGDGGCLITGREDLAEKIKVLRNYGSDVKNQHQVTGVNSRLDELQAAFLNVKLGSLDATNAHKKSLAKIYTDGLKADFIVPVHSADHSDVHHIFAVRHPARDRVREYLLKEGIETAVHYPVPPHRQPALAEMFDKKSFPLSEEIHATVLSLPISSFHQPSDIQKIVTVINKF